LAWQAFRGTFSFEKAAPTGCTAPVQECAPHSFWSCSKNAPVFCAIGMARFLYGRGLWRKDPSHTHQKRGGRFGFFAHRRGRTIPGRFASANRAASSKQARCIRHRRRIACFPTPPNDSKAGVCEPPPLETTPEGVPRQTSSIAGAALSGAGSAEGGTRGTLVTEILGGPQAETVRQTQVKSVEQPFSPAQIVLRGRSSLTDGPKRTRQKAGSLPHTDSEHSRISRKMTTGHFVGSKRFSFGPGADRFLWQEQRKWAAHSRTEAVQTFRAPARNQRSGR